MSAILCTIKISSFLLYTVCITHIYKKKGRKDRRGRGARYTSLVIISTLAPIRIDLSRDPTVTVVVRGATHGIISLVVQ